jgi:hypothetical protein
MATSKDLTKRVSNELRAEMDRQGKNIPALARALEIEIRAARRRYRGTTQLTFSQVVIASSWLNVDPLVLLKPVIEAEAN